MHQIFLMQKGQQNPQLFHSAYIRTFIFLFINRKQFLGYTRRDQEIAWRRQQYQRPVPQRMAPVYQSKRDNTQLLVARRALNNAAPIKRPTENKPEYKSILKPQIIKPATVETPSVLKPPIKVKTRKAPSIPKASPRQGCGLLTDSLSCIFTRRNNQQRKVPQKRVFYEDVPQSEPPKEKENELSDTESTYLPETKPVFVTAQKDCPEPPRISQPTPDISMEDWFTTKQRILGNVKHEENVCEPLKISETKCPEPPHIEVDPHGFDIEPPAHINKNVSPYVPTNSYERDEYEKYKSEKFKKEITLALLQKHYEKAQEAKKQREEAENVQKQSETHYSQVATYVPTQQQYEEDQDMEKYQVDRETYYEQPSYQPTSLQEQTQQYVDTEYYGRYDTYQGNQVTEEHNKLDNENCPEAPQISSMPQEESPPEPPVISQERDDNPQYYQGYTKYDETNTFKEPIAQPIRASNQTMCHKCSFQTTNPKKLRDHLKFVHGEVVAVETAAKPKELFSRRDPKIQEAQEELFSRRGDFPSAQEAEKKNRFKRRNTSAMVNIISSDIVVPARTETETRGEATYEAGDANVETHETGGVLAAMEYFETTKDQPKKPRPYKRDPDQLDNDWI